MLVYSHFCFCWVIRRDICCFILVFVCFGERFDVLVFILLEEEGESNVLVVILKDITFLLIIYLMWIPPAFHGES